jgi:ABC-type amino acid transport substrate-binding protein
MKKLISLVLTLCLAASFAACSNDSADTTAADKDTAAATDAVTDAATDAATEAVTDAETVAETDAATDVVTDAETDAPSTDASSVYGTWKTQLSLSKVMTDSFAASAPGITLPAITGFDIDMVFEINENGTGKIIITEEAVNTAIANTKPSLKATIEALYTAMAAQNNMTLEQLITATGTTIDAIVDDTLEGFSGMATESEGKFLIEGNKLYTEAGENGEIDKTQYITFKLEDGKLVFTEMVVGEASAVAMLDAVLPLVFEKQ